MDDIAPPRPKSHLGRKRGVEQEKRVLSIATKAKYAAKRVIKKQNDKIQKAQQVISKAKEKKETILKTDSALKGNNKSVMTCLLYTSPSPRDQRGSRMPSSA